MKIKQLSVRFTETANEEVNALIHDLQLVPLAVFLGHNNGSIPTEFKDAVAQLLSVLTDLFSIDLPGIEKDPEQALRTISRDINLARLLRERGLFRMYRLVHVLDENNLPLFMSIVNPTSGSPFARQEEFIGWFCDEAHVARSLVFKRLATIDKLMNLAFSLEEAFELVITKPYAIQETLNMVADWEKGEMININPDNVLRIASRIAPSSLAELEPIVQAVKNNPLDPGAQEDLRNISRPIVAGLLTEVAEHDRAKDAMDWVKHDLLLSPEVNYRFDQESSSLLIELLRRQVDPVTGEEYSASPIVIPFVPDTIEDVPAEIIGDLLRRLPIKNRSNVDLDV